MRAAISLLRRFGEREQGEAQRQAVTAWVDHLAHMLAHPYALNGAELAQRERATSRRAA